MLSQCSLAAYWVPLVVKLRVIQSIIDAQGLDPGWVDLTLCQCPQGARWAGMQETTSTGWC